MAAGRARSPSGPRSTATGGCSREALDGLGCGSRIRSHHRTGCLVAARPPLSGIPQRWCLRRSTGDPGRAHPGRGGTRRLDSAAAATATWARSTRTSRTSRRAASGRAAPRAPPSPHVARASRVGTGRRSAPTSTWMATRRAPPSHCARWACASRRSATARPQRMVEGFLPPGAIAAAAQLRQTQAIVAPLARLSAGSILSEGDDAINGPEARALGRRVRACRSGSSPTR